MITLGVAFKKSTENCKCTKIAPNKIEAPKVMHVPAEKYMKSLPGNPNA